MSLGGGRPAGGRRLISWRSDIMQRGMKVSPFAMKGLLSIAVAVGGYLAGYLFLRATSVQRWERDGRDYVIFPKDPLLIYYFYRPLALVDGAVTGMRFHIGPHEEADPAMEEGR